jgi:hypothetical protein
MAIEVSRAARVTGGPSHCRVIGPGGAAYWLSAARGSAAAVITWLGVAGFLLYNSLMFVFATPANRLFPLYLAMLGLSAWSAGALLRQADMAAFGALFSARTPVRGIAVYMWTAVALNAAAWLARIILAAARGGAPGPWPSWTA